MPWILDLDLGLGIGLGLDNNERNETKEMLFIESKLIQRNTLLITLSE